MTQALTHQDYISTLNYKVVRLLACFRSIGNFTGMEALERIAKHKECECDYSILGMIEDGVIQLDDADVLFYTDYISNVYGYDMQKFYEALHKEAQKSDFPCTGKGIMEIVKKIVYSFKQAG